MSGPHEGPKEDRGAMPSSTKRPSRWLFVVGLSLLVGGMGGCVGIGLFWNGRTMPPGMADLALAFGGCGLLGFVISVIGALLQSESPLPLGRLVSLLVLGLVSAFLRIPREHRSAMQVEDQTRVEVGGQTLLLPAPPSMISVLGRDSGADSLLRRWTTPPGNALLAAFLRQAEWDTLKATLPRGTIVDAHASVHTLQSCVGPHGDVHRGFAELRPYLAHQFDPRGEGPKRLLQAALDSLGGYMEQVFGARVHLGQSIPLGVLADEKDDVIVWEMQRVETESGGSADGGSVVWAQSVMVVKNQLLYLTWSARLSPDLREVQQAKVAILAWSQSTILANR